MNIIRDGKTFTLSGSELEAAFRECQTGYRLQDAAEALDAYFNAHFESKAGFQRFFALDFDACVAGENVLSKIVECFDNSEDTNAAEFDLWQQAVANVLEMHEQPHVLTVSYNQQDVTVCFQRFFYEADEQAALSDLNTLVRAFFVYEKKGIIYNVSLKSFISTYMKSTMWQSRLMYASVISADSYVPVETRVGTVYLTFNREESERLELMDTFGHYVDYLPFPEDMNPCSFLHIVADELKEKKTVDAILDFFSADVERICSAATLVDSCCAAAAILGCREEEVLCNEWVNVIGHTCVVMKE